MKTKFEYFKNNFSIRKWHIYPELADPPILYTYNIYLGLKF